MISKTKLNLKSLTILKRGFPTKRWLKWNKADPNSVQRLKSDSAHFNKLLHVKKWNYPIFLQIFYWNLMEKIDFHWIFKSLTVMYRW
jgi:hypothetical protein